MLVLYPLVYYPIEPLMYALAGYLVCELLSRNRKPRAAASTAKL